MGLNVLVQRANKFTPATRLLIQRFVPFPAVGKKPCLFSVFTSPYADTKHRNVSQALASPLCPRGDGRDAAEPRGRRKTQPRGDAAACEAPSGCTFYSQAAEITTMGFFKIIFPIEME